MNNDWIQTDGYGVQFDTNSDQIRNGYDYKVITEYRHDIYRNDDSFYIEILAHADEDACRFTDFTSDGALTGTMVTYTIGQGPLVVTMDSISATDPDCGYTNFNYNITGQTVGHTMTTYGITIDNEQDPPQMTIESEYTPGTYWMNWYPIPTTTNCNSPVNKAWQLQILCELESVTLASGAFSETYTSNVAGDEEDTTLTVSFPFYTQSPNC